MTKYYDVAVAGIDVASDFSVVTILSPTGDIYRKNVKFTHDLRGMTKLIKLLHKAEEEFGSSPKLFCECTGIYHLTLLHFLRSHQRDISAINPLISHSNKNSDIRVVKNDNRDSLTIAKIGKFQEPKTAMDHPEDFLHLKFLITEYYKRVDDLSNLKKSFTNLLYVYYPGLQKAFKNTYCKSGLAFIEHYPTPDSLMAANDQDVVQLLNATAKKGLKWAQGKVALLYKTAGEALELGLNHRVFGGKVKRFVRSHRFLNEQIEEIREEVYAYIDEMECGPKFREDLKLLSSFKGLGTMTAITILSAIGSHDRFSNAQQLVAFFGVDPSVNQSGKFKGDRAHMSKRGTSVGRRVLYSFALQCVKKNQDGKPLNATIHDYYNQQLKHKKKKVRLVAVMHKLLKYIFAVLRDRKPYVVRNAKVHKRMFLEHTAKTKNVAA